ncbi:VENN motif pre-toxin domain-containing protein [Avibacterium avium]|uniref:VENN motif pre-toxin domain-containing protein n=2 Tax=Avibacterium avium TaxID=751 RepID=UPI0039FDA376
MNVKVHQHTQLNGGVIESEAETSKNRLQTYSISSTDIENHSEIKTESASISAGSGGINPMQALSSALSLLGNRHESSRSHTKSAISQNIAIQTKTPENLTALSRDTKNANEQVQKQDLQKVQEQQEMAKVIGEIVDNGISIATFEKREALNKLSLEKFQAEERYGKDSPQAKALGTQMQALQQQLDQEFGLGSEKGMAIRAITAALQSAVQQDKAGAITALASPYLNREIHKLTEGDSTKEKAANLMAHALLSAVEFQVTGKDPLTGAIAGVTGEATAQYLTKALYNKAPSELTASEKETISSLSQLAGGLAGAFTAKVNGSGESQGGSFLSGVAGAETAKRAVENNYVALIARGCTVIPSCRNKVAKEIIEYGVKAGITGVIANEIVENISQEDAEHLITLSLMGNDEVTQKYLNYLTVKYSNSEIKLPAHTGGNQLENKPIQSHTGGNQIIDNELPNNTGGVPIDVNIPSHTDGSPILEEDKTGHILSGSEVQVGDWKENILHSTNYIDKPKQKVNSASVGDIIRTPTTHPGDFSRKRDSKGNAIYVNKYTGEIWSRSNTIHSDKSGEWKVGLDGKEPTISKKFTIGNSDGKIIKKDNK